MNYLFYLKINQIYIFLRIDFQIFILFFSQDASRLIILMFSLVHCNLWGFDSLKVLLQLPDRPLRPKKL